jgi:hypothetical protein
MPERAQHGVVELDERPLREPITTVRLPDGSVMVLPPRGSGGDSGNGSDDDGPSSSTTTPATYPVYTKRYSADGGPRNRDRDGGPDTDDADTLPAWAQRARDALPAAIMVGAAAWPLLSAQWRRWRRRRRQGAEEEEEEEQRQQQHRRVVRRRRGGDDGRAGLAASTVLPSLLGRQRPQPLRPRARRARPPLAGSSVAADGDE